MALTGGYDVCVELAIEVIREIFHLAFKQEDRFPHNFGPFVRTFTVTGGSPLTARVTVRVYDEVDRAADLRFTTVDTMTFTFPVDIDVELDDAPDPELSHMLLTAIIEAPGIVARMPASDVDGEMAVGVHFRDLTAAQVVVSSFSGLPVVDSAVLTRALHHAYENGGLPHQQTQSGITLTLYDGARDTSLTPPNVSGAEIAAVLGAGDWVQITLPVHVGGASSGITINSYGTIVVHRPLQRTSEAVILKLADTPPASDTAHATTVVLAEAPQIDVESIEQAVHDAYSAALLPHRQTVFGNIVQFYDGTLDLTLDPPHPTGAEISAAIETGGGKTWLHLRFPCWAYIASFSLSSFGVMHVHREIVVTATNVVVNFAAVPSEADRQTNFSMDTSAMNGGLGLFTSTIDVAIAGFGTVTRPNPAAALNAAVAQAVDAYLSARGNIVQAAPNEARAIELIQDGVAEYLVGQQFPVYTPDPGENEVELQEPTPRMLVAPEIFAIQFTPRAGETQELPDNFLSGSGSDRMALAVGRALLMERIQDAIDETFPNLNTEQGDLIEEVTNRNVWLKSVSVTPANGHFDVSGTATVEVCCWKDPDVDFSGPFYLIPVYEESEFGPCMVRAEGEAGDFDTSMSSSDIVLAVLVPIVGWIAGIVIAVAIDAVGGGIIDAVADGQAEAIQPIPPVVFGIAAISSCLTDIHVRSDGLVFPGRVATERLDRSFDELEDDRRQPDGGGD